MTAPAFILQSLLRFGDRAVPESTLIAVIREGYRELTVADAVQLIRDLERREFIVGTADDILGRTWMLTQPGRLKAMQV